MKKISLIIPCYNCEKTIDRCLESVFAQNYDNLEIITINDGSKDNTLNILKRYAKNHPNLKVIDKPNGGVSTARNLALKHVTGEYIQFMDSDDNFIGNDVLKKLVETMENSKVDLVVFNFTHPCFESHLKGGIYYLKNKDDFKTYYQDFFASSLPWNKMFKKEVITENYDENMHFAEDEKFNLANLKNIKKVAYLEDIMYNYYCEPLIDKSQASLVNKLYISENFWECKNTIWYKCIDNMQKRTPIFNKDFNEMHDELKYIRPFDFFFFDFAFMNHLNVELNKQLLQCENILKTKVFKQTLTSFEKHGLLLKNNLPFCMKEFVTQASFAFSDLKTNKKSLKLYLVLFTIFGKCFFTTSSKLDTSSLLANCMDEYLKQSTAEAKYAKNILSNDILQRNRA